MVGQIVRRNIEVGGIMHVADDDSGLGLRLKRLIYRL